MAMVRWDPFRDIVSMQDRLNRLVGEGLYRLDRDEGYGAWLPPVDIYEKGDDLVIRAELPGVRREDIDVRVEHGALVLQGERRRDEENEERSAYRLERNYGAFMRSFTLPTTVDASKISAVYKDGVLEVRLPKAESAKPKKVQIQAA